MTKDEALQMCLEYIETDAHERKYVRHAIKAALEAKDEPVAHSVVAGALFDFMGWLTSREKRLILSSVDEASPAVEAITEFAIKRNLSLKYAEVGYWTEFLSPPPQRKPLVFGLNDDGQFTFSVGVQTFTLDYFPENDEETEFMKRQLTHAIEAAHGIKGEA